MDENPLAQILKDIGVLAKENTDSTPGDRLLEIVGDEDQADELSNRLFPHGIPNDGSFFTHMCELRRWVHGKSADDGIGKLWAAAMRRRSGAEREKLLDAFVDDTCHDFFLHLDSLPVVVTDVDLPVESLSRVLPKVYRRIERDGAQAGFWSAVQALCMHRTDTALLLVSSFGRTPTESGLAVAAYILGILRGLPLDTRQRQEFHRVEAFFRSHVAFECRSSFHWSFVTSARDYGLTADALDEIFLRAQAAEQEEADSILAAVCRIVVIGKLEHGIRATALTWISQRISSSISRIAKYHIADAARSLRQPGSNEGQPCIDCSNWILAIQPVPVEDIATWNATERYFVDLLESDSGSFCHLFEALANANAATLLTLVKQPHTFEFLLHKMQSEDVGPLVGRLMTSRNTASRRLGLHLFDKLGQESIPPETLDEAGEIGTQLVFFELQRSMPGPETIARVLVSLILKSESMNEEFQAELRGELELQARNFVGECRKELQRIGSHLPIVQTTVAQLASYFQMLEAAHRSNIQAMHVVGERRASVVYRRRMSRHVSASAAEHSVLLRLSKKTHLLYGMASSLYINHILQNAHPLAELSTGVEIPFVDFYDPEMMAMRRIHASAKIQSLLCPDEDSMDDGA